MVETTAYPSLLSYISALAVALCISVELPFLNRHSDCVPFKRFHLAMGRRQRPAPTQPTPPLEELDIAAFSEVLRPTGLLIRDVANDGNCFFRAVSDQLYGSEHEHMKLRQLACDYLEAHADHYKHFVDEEQGFDEYVNEMRNDGVWADNLELQAISMACHINIRVHQSGKPSYDIRNHPAKNATTIHLSYHFGEHYASVRPIHTADMQVPAQHDPMPLPRPPAELDRESKPAREEGSNNRRLRFRKHSDQHSVSVMWKRVERAHHDACAVVEKARRAAKHVRANESSAKRASDAKNTVQNIEREMTAARKTLEAHFDTIDKARSSYRKRAHKLQKERRRRFTSGSSSSHSDGSSTQPDESSDDEQRYRDSVRRHTENIHEELLNIENSARAALHVISQLEQQSAKKAQGKHAKSSKKREQEAKKKERKERRRRAQEKIARDEPEYTRPKTPQPHELDIAI